MQVDIDETDPNQEDNRYRATRTGTITIVDDSDEEDDELIAFYLNRVTDGDNPLSPNVVLGGNFLRRITILDNDSSDTTLSGLTLTAGSETVGHMSPDFDPATIAYTAGVGNAIAQVTVTPTATHPNAAVTFPSTSDRNSGVDGHQVNLAVSENNLIKVQVMAENGTDFETYSVTVTRTPPVTSLTPPASDPTAPYETTVEYDIRFVGDWTRTSHPVACPAARTSRPSSVACTATASSSWRAAGWRAARLNRWRKKA